METLKTSELLDFVNFGAKKTPPIPMTTLRRMVDCEIITPIHRGAPGRGQSDRWTYQQAYALVIVGTTREYLGCDLAKVKRQIYALMEGTNDEEFARRARGLPPVEREGDESQFSFGYLGTEEMAEMQNIRLNRLYGHYRSNTLSVSNHTATFAAGYSPMQRRRAQA
jgi:hypothetical protein